MTWRERNVPFYQSGEAKFNRKLDASEGGGGKKREGEVTSGKGQRASLLSSERPPTETDSLAPVLWLRAGWALPLPPLPRGRPPRPGRRGRGARTRTLFVTALVCVRV